MFDIHSHFLPKLDDGSKSVEESVTMLKESYRQGVTDIAATPHFYPSVHNPKQWFVARDHSVRRLIPYLTEDMPDIWLGAEVHYYDGIYRSEEILLFLHVRCKGNGSIYRWRPSRAYLGILAA